MVAVSLEGTSHQKRDLPCQDAHYWQLVGDLLLVAGVADGAGSVSLSEVGSLLAVQTAVKGIASKIAESSIPDSDEGWKVLLNGGLEDALVAIQAEAESRQVNMRELSTTLLIVVATPDLVAAIQVGDGAIVVANQKGTAITLTTSPPIEESLDLATFLTSPNGIDSAQICLWEGKPAQLAMFSDGLQMLALQMPQGVAHAPFFAPLFKFIAESKDLDAAHQELTGFLRSPRVCDRTDDDLTLLLAALTS
ncbi:MAG: hypothetical protein AUK48_12695 [Oscillatoriales cyanobacterium CG2_30_44_21]|nr:MAG: hypothetical protein AUK48_12695 [Oscillatoriales cyanobacterium CG2_30_44_21]